MAGKPDDETLREQAKGARRLADRLLQLAKELEAKANADEPDTPFPPVKPRTRKRPTL